MIGLYGMDNMLSSGLMDGELVWDLHGRGHGHGGAWRDLADDGVSVRPEYD